jgi:glycine/D-amino acid oxidase-like deaminating enzyme/nitrite reductase/ring-hydroxylating ferredoxin subunit
MPDRAEGLPGRPQSLWMGTTPRTDYPALDGDARVDVAILGGGIAGITAAVLLKEAGLTVAVLEARRIVEGVTGHTTAKVTSLHTLLYRDLLHQHGEDTARAYGEANQAAVERVARFVEERRIDCDFARADAFTYAEAQEDVARVEEEAALTARLGLPADLTTDVGLPFPVRAAVRFRDQARFHPRKYLLALASSIPGGGSDVFEQTTATDVQDGDPSTVTTDKGVVRASHVIVATHQPFLLRGFYFARMTLKRSHVLALRLDGPVPRGLYISAEASGNFRSMRPHVGDDGELLILGGEPHKPGQEDDTAERVRRLEAWARERFPVRSVEYRWATQDNVTPDRIPYVGRLVPGARRLWVATGFGGWGMTNATVAGMLLSDLVRERENPWAKFYDPGRGFFTSTVSGLAKDAVVGVKDLLGGFGGETAKTIDGLAPGEGRIVEHFGEKVAASRDHAGAVHAVSAVCTHLQCLVRWNSAEESWDCPCHGSRFDPRGRVLQGPAISDLPRVDLGEKRD